MSVAAAPRRVRDGDDSDVHSHPTQIPMHSRTRTRTRTRTNTVTQPQPHPLPARKATTGHGLGGGSASGAGLWLSSGDSSAVIASSPSASAPSAQGEPRRYHISESASAGARFSGIGHPDWDLLPLGISRLDAIRGSTETDRVDLDLSFDFVSQLEAATGRQRQASSTDSSESASDSPSVSPARPRGMSDVMLASGRRNSRKKPPKPLAFAPVKKPANTLRSHFSPDTAVPSHEDSDDGADDGEDEDEDEEPALSKRQEQTRASATPTSASASTSASARRRSRTLSSTRPLSRPPNTPLPALPSPSQQQVQVQQQRAARLLAREQQSSPIPAPAPALVTPLDQVFRSTDVEVPNAPRRPLRRTAGTRAANLPLRRQRSAAELLAPPASATDVDADLSGNAALLSPTPGAGDAVESLVNSPNPPARELPSLGSRSHDLDLAMLLKNAQSQASAPMQAFAPPPVERSSSPHAPPTLTNTESSPASHQLSTPETPASSLFDVRSNYLGSEYSKTTVSDGLGGYGMLKTASHGGAPLAVAEAIQEDPLEDRADLSLASMGMDMGISRSETETWIRAQQQQQQREQEQQRQRQRQETASSNNSTDTASSAEQHGVIHPMVLSTASSTDVGAAAPWPQSPMLLQSSNEGEAAVGLGLFCDASSGTDTGSASTTADKSSQSIGAASPAAASHTPQSAAPPATIATPATTADSGFLGAGLTASPSHASSVDGFAWNVTPLPTATATATPGPTVPQRTHQSPAAATRPRSKSRFGWDLLRHSGSSAKDSKDTARERDSRATSPQIRQLTLVSIQEQRSSTVTVTAPAPASRRHSMDTASIQRASLLLRSPAAAGQLEPPFEEEGAAPMQAPSTAPLPSVAFPAAAASPTATTAVPTAFERTRRSSKHVRRVSRIHYIPDRTNSEDVRLSIPPTEAEAERDADDATTMVTAPESAAVSASASDEAAATAKSRAAAAAALEAFKSPRPGPSPSGWTPDMVYGHPRSRFSWGYAPRTADSPLPPPPAAQRAESSSSGSASATASTPRTPSSPWLDFTEDGSGLRAAQERGERLSGSGTAATSTADTYMYSEFAVGGATGLRRRSTLEKRHSASGITLPPTASVRPFLARQPSSRRRSSMHTEVLTEDGEPFARVEEEQRGLRRLRLLGDVPPEEVEDNGAKPSPMDIYVPLGTLQAHIRRQSRDCEGGMHRLSMRSHTRNREQQRGAGGMLAAGSQLVASSGQLLDAALPSRTLFFAGFLGMPWLWLIGGWWLAHDGHMPPPSAQQVQFFTHEPSMRAAVVGREQQGYVAEKSAVVRDGATEHEHEHEHGQAGEHHALAQMARHGHGHGHARRTSIPLSTIYSESCVPTLDAEAFGGTDADARTDTPDGDGDGDGDGDDDGATAPPSLYTGRDSVSPLSFGSGTDAGAGAGAGASRAPSSASTSSSTVGPRTLVASNPSKIPRNARRSIRSLLNPCPEVALFQSPVRTLPLGVADPDATENLGNAMLRPASAAPSASISDVPLSRLASVEELARLHPRPSSRTSGRASTYRYPAESTAKGSSMAQAAQSDDSGLDLLPGVGVGVGVATSTVPSPRVDVGVAAEDEDSVAGAALHPQLRHQPTLALLHMHMQTQAQARDPKLALRERLARTERFVLLNRFMAVVSLLGALAGLGAALNAVAMHF